MKGEITWSVVHVLGNFCVTKFIKKTLKQGQQLKRGDVTSRTCGICTYDTYDQNAEVCM